MVQNIENGATLQELTDKSRNFKEKVEDIIDGKGQQKTFQKLLEYISQSPQYNQSRHSHSRENVYEATDQQQVEISGNTGTIPK